MAITQNPITGTMRKTAGGMVFSRSLDQNVMRAKPITYNDRKSDAQVKQRVRMKACHGLSKADSKKALDAAFPTRPTKQTKFSAFVQAIIKVINGGLTSVTYDWTNLLSFGNGTLRNLLISPSFTKAVSTFQINWTNPLEMTLQEEISLVYIFLFNTTKGQGYSVVTDTSAESLSLELNYPTGWVQADTIKCYVGTTSPALYNSSPAVQIV